MLAMLMDFSDRHIFKHKYIHSSLDVPISMWLLGGMYE